MKRERVGRREGGRESGSRGWEGGRREGRREGGREGERVGVEGGREERGTKRGRESVRLSIVSQTHTHSPEPQEG